jgi:WD repeat-containing protein 61
MAALGRKHVVAPTKVATSGESVWSVTWSQGDLLAGLIDGSLKVLNSPTYDVYYTTKNEKIGITSIVALQDGSTAIACYQDSMIRFFDLINKKEIESIDAGFLEAYSISLHPQEEILISGNHSGGVNIWSMEAGHEKVATFPTAGKHIISTNINYEGKILTSGLDGLIQVLDVSTQQLLYRIDEHTKPVRSVCFSPNGDLICSACEDREANIYDLRTGQCIFTFCQEGMAMSIDASANRRHVVVGGSDGRVAVWDMGMGRLVEKWNTHRDIVWSVKYDKTDSTGTRFASGGDDGVVQIFDKPKPKEEEKKK